MEWILLFLILFTICAALNNAFKDTKVRANNKNDFFKDFPTMLNASRDIFFVPVTQLYYYYLNIQLFKQYSRAVRYFPKLFGINVYLLYNRICI